MYLYWSSIVKVNRKCHLSVLSVLWLFKPCILLFLLNIASKCRTVSNTCCNYPIIQSFWLCKIFVLVQYLNRKIHTEPGQLLEGQGHLDSETFFFSIAITLHVLSIKASYYIFDIWMVKRSRVLIFEANGQRSINLWLPGCISIIKEYFNISSPQLLPSLYKYAGWLKEYANNVTRTKKIIS